MTAYLAGPMTGLPQFNYGQFHCAAADLRERGLTVVNPAELFDGDTGHDRKHYIREGIRALLDCDQLVLLPGWINSRGALLELSIAQQIGLRITQWQPATGVQVEHEVTEVKELPA